jgi:iron complex transport system substrate-binding protein
VKAVKQGRVHIFGEDYVTIPGPRFTLLLEQMATVLHPELQIEPGLHSGATTKP